MCLSLLYTYSLSADNNCNSGSVFERKVCSFIRLMFADDDVAAGCCFPIETMHSHGAMAIFHRIISIEFYLYSQIYDIKMLMC